MSAVYTPPSLGCAVTAAPAGEDAGGQTLCLHGPFSPQNCVPPRNRARAGKVNRSAAHLHSLETVVLKEEQSEWGGPPAGASLRGPVGDHVSTLLPKHTTAVNYHLRSKSVSPHGIRWRRGSRRAGEWRAGPGHMPSPARRDSHCASEPGPFGVTLERNLLKPPKSQGRAEAPFTNHSKYSPTLTKSGP